MKWKKLGQIFDPTAHQLSNSCVEFAQSPQVLVFDDFIRIYFSTREKDETGKYLSHISFVDMDKSFQKVIGVSSKTVIKLGGLGCFDEHGIFPMNVLRDKDKILAYTTGWNRRVSVSTDASIGLAVSVDGGVTFNKVGKGPVLSSSLHEPFLVGDAFVAIYRNIYHMWYIHGTKWASVDPEEAPDRVYKIAHATSQDGISWRKEGRQIVADRLNDDECQALPTVICLNDKYHMFFCYRYATDFRKNKNRGYRIGYAYSDDLIHWTRDDGDVGIDVTEGSWDSDMLCYPHVFEMDGNVYMLYNGNEFGRFGFGLAKLEQ
ncbi:hypothetical protein Ga0123461_1874 [Mariprofundus aestuarium]|uniref:Glycosyl hydrolase family 32 N-terminal domain-containing protein n=1 Tax=Mariprofundus aestuarium TaxID=1921086 RepID=A0A2K8L7N6_MARES|nr:hypothetical protein [Mariprofundus aestuarium]ATX80286.1 hypothetical protein Ga0123461_1874 [Mariprofundus aestuarium]